MSLCLKAVTVADGYVFVYYLLQINRDIERDEKVTGDTH